jgi:hypothetical protein
MSDPIEYISLGNKIFDGVEDYCFLFDGILTHTICKKYKDKKMRARSAIHTRPLRIGDANPNGESYHHLIQAEDKLWGLLITDGSVCIMSIISGPIDP